MNSPDEKPKEVIELKKDEIKEMLSSKIRGKFNSLLHKEDQALVLKVIADYPVLMSSEKVKDGSRGYVEITHREMKDLIAYALGGFSKKPNHGCKDCWEKGKIIRTSPIPGMSKEAGMHRARTDCHCVRIKEEEHVNYKKD